MSWEPELEELRRREELARRMGGEERVARQHESGRLTVRERISGGAARGDRGAAGGGDVALPNRRALQRRGDHRPARHAPDPVRSGRARARAGEVRAAPGTKDTRP